MQNGMCAFAPVPGERDAYRCRGGRVVRTRTLPIWSRCDCRIELSTLAQSGDPRADRRPVPQADVLAAAKTAACQYLGEEVGRRPCDSCRGRVLVKKFACRHPAHERTTLAQCAACPDYVPSPGLPAAAVLAAAKTASGENRRSILLRFPHGLGDAVQLTAVLLHLRAVHPGVGIDVACKVGQHTLLAGLARRAFVLGREPPEAYEPHQYDLIRTLAWHEPERCYADSPSTKAEKCLREVLGIAPREDLCRYEIAPGPEATARARQYADSIGRPYVLIHYQGNSASRHKNLDERTVAALGRRIAAHGHAAVVLDWDRRSGLVDERNVLCPGADHALWNGTGTGDGATLAALVQLAAWCVGIDSGPGHVFAATVRSP
ncbi:MAG: hypothetical protein HYS13_01345, partial [Planctomycetia bacterium]|nr:hypothetical protein [Planctomycetia bacterium]